MMQLPFRFHWILIPGALLAGASLGWTQARPHAVVSKATRQALSPPLNQIAPLSPPSGRSDFDPDDGVRLRRAEHAKGVQQDPVLQGSLGKISLSTLPSLPANAGVNILGLGVGFAGYNPQITIPADPNGAVGATQFVQFVNDSFAVFDKSTGNTLSGPTLGNVLWQPLGAPCATSPNLDEVAQYDKLANRWVLMMPDFSNPNYLCFAVSTTSDAVTSSWNLYAFQPATSQLCNCRPFPDYPKLSVWPDGYYISYNQGDNGSYVGGAACVVDRNAMLSGAAATMQCFPDNDPSYGSLLPVDLDGTTSPPTGTPGYFLNFDANDQSLDLWQLHVDWTTPANSTFTGPTNIPVAAFTEACGESLVEINYPSTNACIPQAQTAQMLDSYGDRLMYRAAYRNFGSYASLVANHTVTIGSASSQTGIRWYELRDSGSGFAVYQQGTYAPDSSYRWMGSIAMDHVGNMALGYSVSDSDISPSIRYTGRLATDALDQMESEVDVLSSAGVANGSQTQTYRWADYSGMGVDPSDDCTFWYTTEYIPTTGGAWATRIASFSFPSCTNPTAPDFTVSPSPATSTVSAGGTASFNVQIAAVGGFSGAVTMSCSAPVAQGINCSFSPTSVNPGSSTSLSVTTTGPSAALSPLAPGTHSGPGFAAGLGLLALALAGAGSAGRKQRRIAGLLLYSVLLSFVVLQMACSSSNSGNKGGGTAPGTYTVNFTATSGSLQHGSSVTIMVQ